MTTIAKVEAIPFKLEMKGALRWGAGSELSELHHVFVKITASDEQYGIAEAPVRPTIYGETVESIESITRLFSQKIIGVDIFDDQEIQSRLDPIKNNNCAKGALDMALHELRAKSQNQSLFTKYAGKNRKVRVSYILGISDIETMLEEARSVFASGVSVFKIKIGRDLSKDLQIIQSLKSEFAGTNFILYVDANQTLTTENVTTYLEKLAQLDVAYIEEPLPIHLIKERAKLKAQQILPIIADDSTITCEDLIRELTFDTFDILNIKTARTGYTHSLQMLNLAKEYSKGVMLGSQASAGLGTMYCALFASDEYIEYPSELSFSLKLKEDVLTEKLVYENGYLDINSLQNNKLQNHFLET